MLTLSKILVKNPWLNQVRHFLLSKTLSKILMWLFILYLGKVSYDATQYSFFLTFILLSQLSSGIVNAGFPAAILRFGTYDEQHLINERHVWGISLVYNGLMTIFFIILFNLLGKHFTDIPTHIGIWGIILGFIIAQEANIVSLFQLRGRSDLYEKYYLLLSALLTLLFLNLIFLELNTTKIIIFFVLLNVIMVFWGWVKSWEIIGLPSIRKWKRPLAYTLPLVPHLVAMYFLTSADYFMIKKLLGDNEAGIYGFAYQAGSIITLFTLALVTYITPIFFKSIQQDSEDTLTKLNRQIDIFSYLIFTISIISNIFFWFGVKYYFPNFEQSIPVFFLLTPSFTAHFLYAVASLIISYYGYNHLYSLISICCLCFNVLLNYFCIPTYGIASAAIINIATYYLLSIIHVFVSKRITKTILNLQKPYILLGLSILFSILLNFIFKFKS